MIFKKNKKLLSSIQKKYTLQIQNNLFISKDEAKTAVRSITYCGLRSYTSTYYHVTQIGQQWRLCKGRVERNYCYGGCNSYYSHSHFNYARQFCSCCKPRQFTHDNIRLVLDCGRCDTYTVTYDRINPTSCSCSQWYLLQDPPRPIFSRESAGAVSIYAYISVECC